jgi:hypothetical protein
MPKRCGSPASAGLLHAGTLGTVETEWEKEMRASFIFGVVVAAMLAVPFVAMSCSDASAQQRATCSQARSHCGTQRVCQRRYETCVESGCWTVGLLKRCGYEKE